MEIKETPPETIKGKIEPVDGGFRFACHPGVSCFTECCRDLNLLLNPCDVMRLKERLGLSSNDFLDRNVHVRFDENRALPIAYLQVQERSTS